jgi:mannose-1-phosphate guanylyltransferase
MLWALVMAGGAGKRLWPLSTKKKSKPFLKLIPGQKTLLEETLKRIKPVIGLKQTWVIGDEENLSELRQLARDVPRSQVLGEPCSRNTAPTVGLCAKLIYQIDPKGILLTLPADHEIREYQKFRTTLRLAVGLAEKHQTFAVFGVQPDFPSTSYGYLELGPKIDRFTHRLTRFCEKPKLKRARHFYKSKRFLWHAGIFAAPVSNILGTLEHDEPRLYRRLKTLLVGHGKIRPTKRFAKLPNRSFDVAVLERLKNALAIKCPFSWSDIGSWDSLSQFWVQDPANNASLGDLKTRGSKGNLVCAPKKKVCLNNVDDLVIVDSGDTLFITKKGDSEKLRSAVKQFSDTSTSR